jgi:preprotein translocase subunit SecE
MRKFINYLKESYVEMTKKVAWPSWSKLQNAAIVVMVASVIFAIVILGMDSFFQWLMSAIYTL